MINNKKKNTEKSVIKNQWLENVANYGISFKVKIDKNKSINEKYISITLNENGRIEYKNQYKEEDNATIDDIKGTYDYVKDLLKKINNENNKLELLIPDDQDFDFAFINTIQKFELPKKFIINHNDLSDFARYFFPYISLVIDPRKRKSKSKKQSSDSKYGTYLRYKRISKYENSARIEHRIIHFRKNYEFNDKDLALEIAKQFNITDKYAEMKIAENKKKISNGKKIKKNFKKIRKFTKI